MRYRLTAGEIRQALAGVDDSVPILFNVETDSKGDNWDTWDASIHNSSYMCQGEPGCTHEEPEMLWDIVVFVRHPSVGEDSITSR